MCCTIFLEDRMRIVFLDRKTLGEDIDLSGFERFGEVVMYDFTTPEEMPERVRDADILILNKAQVNEQTCGGAEHLKLVCVTATGTNNLDKDFLDGRELPGEMWQDTLQNPSSSIPLPCCFICWSICLITIIMSRAAPTLMTAPLRILSVIFMSCME
jgi:hypothetical protein